MTTPKHLARTEFVILMALLTSIIALAIDGMLPAFPKIAEDLNVQSPNDLSLIIAILFFGYGIGQLVFGPISDVIGRKQPIYYGVAIFCVGAVLSGFAPNFEIFLVGRFLQGFGGAAPRIISLALVRDEYSGNAMAKITSLIMTIFILVPAIAPTMGQAVLFFASWRAIFIVLFAVGVLTWTWFGIRQHETLPKASRSKLSLAQLKYGVKETFSQPTTVACIAVSGLLFGIFVAYLGAVQEIFTSIFHVGESFPMYFGILALAIGASSFFNSRLVMIFGMHRLIFFAFICMAVLSNIFSIYLTQLQLGVPPLWLFMSYMILTFLSVGFLFGNLNALAMQPLGHIAGMASALLGSIQTLISVVIGVLLGRYFHDDILPLVLSFGTISIICIGILWRWVKKT